MMNYRKKLTTRQQAEEQQQSSGEHQTRETSAHEFASPEEMLRHDALHTPVPPAIAHRLQESIGRTPLPPPSWWRRFFGK